MQSVFVVIEGANGVGKTTIVDVVCKQLNCEAITLVRTKEPTKSELGIYIRENQNRYSKEVLACLVAANRYEHLETVVYPAIKTGNVVVCDRYYPSTLVYQLMDGLELSFVDGLNKKILIPDLTIFLTAEESVLKRRLMARNQLTRFEKDQKREVQLYKEARLILESRGWNIFSIDTGALDAKTIADSIISQIMRILRSS